MEQFIMSIFIFPFFVQLKYSDRISHKYHLRPEMKIFDFENIAYKLNSCLRPYLAL
jgi:hypothetical protein